MKKKKLKRRLEQARADLAREWARSDKRDREWAEAVQEWADQRGAGRFVKPRFSTDRIGVSGVDVILREVYAPALREHLGGARVVIPVLERDASRPEPDAG